MLQCVLLYASFGEQLRLCDVLTHLTSEEVDPHRIVNLGDLTNALYCGVNRLLKLLTDLDFDLDRVRRCLLHWERKACFDFSCVCDGFFCITHKAKRFGSVLASMLGSSMHAVVS